MDYVEISDELNAMLKEIETLRNRVIKLSIAITAEMVGKIERDIKEK